MADDDEVAKVDESPRRIEEGLGLVTDEKLNQEKSEESGGEGDDVVGEMVEELEAVVESEKSEIGGSEVRGVLEVEGAGIAGIGELVDKDEVGVELDESGMAGVVELEGGEPERDEKAGDVTVVEEHVLNETRIDQEDNNLGGNKSEGVEDEDVKKADIGGGTESQSEFNVDNLYPDFKTETAAVIEDYHINDAVEEKGEDFETAEQCVVMTACDDAGQTDESSKTVKEEDGEENVAGNSDLIGLVVEDYHMDDAVEEKREDFEKNPAVEQSALMNACDKTEQIDESMKTVKEEDGEENDAVKSDFIGVEPTREHIDETDNTENEGGDEDEVMGTEEEVGKDNIAGKSDLVGVETTGDHIDESNNTENEGGDEDEVMGTEEDIGKENIAGNSDLVGVETTGDHIDESDNTEKEGGDEDEVMGTEEEVGEGNVAGKYDLVGVEPTSDQIKQSDKIENEGHDEDELGTEEDNVENKEKVEQDVDVSFSLHNVELEPTTGENEIDQEFVDGEEPAIADTEIETQIDTPDAEKGNTKQKRGRKPGKVALTKKTTEEDVCFICFDGGDLVVCDRRGCPKVYHPSCVNRDEAFFKAKGRWNCGWHLCSKCEKNAQYMCFTCTFSLCKGCIKDTVFYSVRGNKGLCETCLKTVNLIESKEQGDNEAQFNFNDKNCWEYLFKDYWTDLKGKLQLTSEELAQAKNSWKGFDGVTSKQKSTDGTYNVDNNADSGSNNSSGNAIAITPKRKKSKKQAKSVAKGEDSPSGSDSSGNGSKSKRRKIKKQTKSLRKRGSSGNDGEGGLDSGSKWASSELLKFVMHMRNGDASVLSQFEVQELLLEYIKTNKLRDPRRKSQIICDTMLKGLFRKQRVAHFEMLKLLESHFLMREDGHLNDFPGSGVDNESSPLDEVAKADTSAKTNKNKKRKMLKKGFGRGTKSNTEEYAAIDIHNISLVFLRRNLMEILLEDVDNFQDKVVGAFVRIRITGSNQIQDMYRLVQIVGTTKAPAPYKVGKRTTDIHLEIQNLNKQEVVSIDIISNQEFTEDECNRLRQSIKCGLIPRLTLGDVLEKAMDLQAARVTDWLETEMVRLSHLCDRASDMGRRKELRENVEKLQNLKKPEERQRRLQEIPKVHSDPKMDPSYESEEDEEEADDRKKENFARPRGSGFTRQGKDTLSPRKGGSVSTDTWSGTKGHSGMSRELGRSLSSKGFSNRGEDTSFNGEINRDVLSHTRSNEHEPLNDRDKQKVLYNSQLSGRNTHEALTSESVSGVVSDAHQATLSSQTAPAVNESEKMWHYKDPSGKVQGPFSIVQLRKWNSTGFFPKDLTVWRTNEGEDDGILLLDALSGKFQKESKFIDNQSNKFSNVQTGQSSLPHSGRPAANGSIVNSASPSQISSVGRASLSVDVPMSSAGTRSSGYDSRNEFTNLPSPTPNQMSAVSTGADASVNRIPSVSRHIGASLSADSTQLYRSTNTSSDANPYQATYGQQTSSTGYHPQQHDLSASSVNAGADSRIPVSAVSSMMQSAAPQQSGQSGSNNQILLSASNTYNQWGNPTAAGSEKPSGSFQNQAFSGTSAPAPANWRPPTFPVNQPGMQPMVLGNPNMGWGVIPANANVSWTPTGQVTPQMNPNWAVQGMAPVIGNATAGWVPSGNGMPGYIAPGNNQVGGMMNPGWSGPTAMSTNTNQAWAAAGQGGMPNNVAPMNSNNQGSWTNGNERQWNNRQQGSMGGEGGGGSYNQRGGPTRVCEYYLSNRCRKGNSCRWLHPQRQ
ncbi:hypothetical protein QQ045_010575 [Rhodiola kirilowii]